jgi:hypothetical protein
MSWSKLLTIFTVLLFSVILITAFFKSDQKDKAAAKQKTGISSTKTQANRPLASESFTKTEKIPKAEVDHPSQSKIAYEVVIEPPTAVQIVPEPHPEATKKSELPSEDRISELFQLDSKLPIVETLTYKSRVPWQEGRSAWLSDYARFYKTSRHFIARSLNGKPDYFKQDLVENARFNVLRLDKNIEFYLLADLSQCKLGLYYDDLDANERVLLKTYSIGVGRLDSMKKSGSLTPTGKYSLGNKVAIYKPKMMGLHNGSQVEMVSVFGTRWIPFDKEISNCTAPAKGLGIHGLPWIQTAENIQEDRSSLGKYESDGCIRLASEDMEEIFAIVISRPATIEIVKGISEKSEKELHSLK